MGRFLVLFLPILAIAQQAPLLDRELFFGDPEISGAKLSPDGRYLSFLKPSGGVRNIWVKRMDAPFSSARPVTASPKHPIPNHFWSRDGRTILYTQDSAGDENHQLFAVDPTTPQPSPRPLAALPGVAARVYYEPPTTPGVLYIGLNNRDKAWHDLYRLDLRSGERTLVRRNEDRIVTWTFSRDGRPRLATRSMPSGDTEILRVDGEKLTPIYRCTVLEYCRVGRMSLDGKTATLETNGGDADLVSLYLLDLATGKATRLEQDPDGEADLSQVHYRETDDSVAGTVYSGDRNRTYFRDRAWTLAGRALSRRFPGMEWTPISCTADDVKCLIQVYSGSDPGSVLVLDRRSGRLTPQYSVRERLPREALAPVEAIRYPSSDGLAIRAYLTIPKGATRPMPLIVLPHGGPWYRDYWGYAGWAQFLANRGYAVLQPNFRGSIGFGKRFLNAGNREWGRKMQDDLTWGVKHLIGTGLADPKRVGILGASYGGYATLAGLAFTPDVFQAGVAIVAPANLNTLLASVPAYWEGTRRVLYERMGDPGTAEGREALRRQSPLFAAEKIRAPLLVVQGANDPRVTRIESDQIVTALRDRRFPVQYLVAPDEGHGFRRPVNEMAMFLATEQFLAKHLGGRAQDSAPAEVAERLKAIQVDPATVQLPRSAAPRAAATKVPPAGLRRYRITTKTGDRTDTIDSESMLVRSGEQWEAREVFRIAGSEIVEEATLEVETLQVKTRKMGMGRTRVEMAVAGNELVWTTTRNGEVKESRFALTGPLFADGAGSARALGALPLAEGYEAVFLNFEFAPRAEKPMRLRVAGKETITVPAGTFPAWKLEVGPAAGGETGRFWIDAETGEYLKSSASTGATAVVAELTAIEK